MYGPFQIGQPLRLLRDLAGSVAHLDSLAVPSVPDLVLVCHKAAVVDQVLVQLIKAVIKAVKRLPDESALQVLALDRDIQHLRACTGE